MPCNARTSGAPVLRRWWPSWLPCARAAPALPDSDAAGLTGMRREKRVHSKLEPSRTGGFLHFLAKWTNIPCPVPIVFELADSPLSARSHARSGGWFRQLLTRREHLRSRFKILGHDCSQRESPSGADRLPPTGPADEGRGAPEPGFAADRRPPQGRRLLQAAALAQGSGPVSYPEGAPSNFGQNSAGTP